MNSFTHPIEKEELMAYCDGELPVERAAAVASHLEQCAECRALAGDFRLGSERLAAWQVEPSPSRLAQRIAAAVQEHAGKATQPQRGKPRSTMFEPPRPLIPRWVWGFAGGFACLLLIAVISIPNLLRSRVASDQASRAARERFGGSGLESESKDQAQPVPGSTAPYSPQQAAGPLIIRTASLALVSKGFDQTRAAIEAIVRQHHGYSAQLTASGQAGAGRSLTATFRVPADQLDAALAEMKNLGRVERESQGGEEVTRQYADLGARLSNARITEQRLIEILRQRTGKVADILSVEREIARVRDEIERLEAQLKSLDNQVRYASLQVRLSEEYKAQLEGAPTSTGTRLHNALVEGYESVVASAIGLAVFTLSYGPTLILWCLILYWPARLAWRQWRAHAG